MLSINGGTAKCLNMAWTKPLNEQSHAIPSHSPTIKQAFPEIKDLFAHVWSVSASMPHCRLSNLSISSKLSPGGLQSTYCKNTNPSSVVIPLTSIPNDCGTLPTQNYLPTHFRSLIKQSNSSFSDTAQNNESNLLFGFHMTMIKWSFHDVEILLRHIPFWQKLIQALYPATECVFF